MSCPTLETRSVDWLDLFPQSVVALATNAQSQTVFLSWVSQGETPGLLDPRGQQLWSGPALPSNMMPEGLSVAPSTGNLYAWGASEEPVSGIWNASAYRIGVSSPQPTLIGQGGDEVSVGPYLEDALGNLLKLNRSSSGSGFTYTSHTGTSWWLGSSYDVDNAPGLLRYAGAAFDAQGQVVVMATLSDTTVFQGHPLGKSGQDTLVVLKLSAQQELLWIREIATTESRLYQLGVARTGQVVIEGDLFGTLSWPGGPITSTQVTRNEFLLSLNARGEPLWARLSPTNPYHRHQLAVSASGASLITGESGTSANGWDVSEYGPEGCLRWSHTYTAQESAGRVSGHGAWVGEEAVLGGGFNGTVDFGSGPQQASLNLYAPAGFIVKLRSP